MQCERSASQFTLTERRATLGDCHVHRLRAGEAGSGSGCRTAFCVCRDAVPQRRAHGGGLRAHGAGALAAAGIAGEVVVSDNGSTDNSVAVAQEAGRESSSAPCAGTGAPCGLESSNPAAVSSSWATPTRATIFRTFPRSCGPSMRARILSWGIGSWAVSVRAAGADSHLNVALFVAISTAANSDCIRRCREVQC